MLIIGLCVPASSVTVVAGQETSLPEFNPNLAALNNHSITMRKSTKFGSPGAKHGGAFFGWVMAPVLLVHLLQQDSSFFEKSPFS
jgi:hypothetical protein